MFEDFQTCENIYHPDREVLLTKLLILVTILSTIFFSYDTFHIVSLGILKDQFIQIVWQLTILIFMYWLIYGNLVYQFARIGYLTRLKHHRLSRKEIREFSKHTSPTLIILVPSYKEDLKVVRQTLLSAALQDYPKKRIVLLIDDAPNPDNEHDKALLTNARNLPLALDSLFDIQQQSMDRLADEFLQRAKMGKINTLEEAERLITAYHNIIDFYRKLIDNSTDLQNHTDDFFIKKIILDPIEMFQKRIAFLSFDRSSLTHHQIFNEYQRITRLFDVRLTSFQRKRYANLSHEPNKAANLNSYISLIGHSLRETTLGDNLVLEKVNPEIAQFSIPDTDFVINLDADSLILPSYAATLIDFMEREENAKVGVVQTPYSAVPHARNQIERIAGATTDIQYIIHQGFTHFSSTYWVGANALIRKKALDAIKTYETERGYTIEKFIQDRTVIEDTESTIDLIDKGWELYNYPERLTYSATPPDFGSLLIQRRRWANGGLIILPKLLRYLFLRPMHKGKISEGFMRFHYLVSTFVVNFGLLVLLLLPLNANLPSIWLPITALPYYFLYGRDLGKIGYKKADLLRVYALNLMLIPINLGGALKSIQQGITGKKIPFIRTPKVNNRTSSPLLYIVAEYFLLFYCLFALISDLMEHHWLQVAISIVNVSFFGYILINYIGIKESLSDLLAYFKPNS